MWTCCIQLFDMLYHIWTCRDVVAYNGWDKTRCCGFVVDCRLVANSLRICYTACCTTVPSARVGMNYPALRPLYRIGPVRIFSAADPTGWNSLPDFIWDPTICVDSFRRLLKTYLFARNSCTQRVRGSLTITALYKSTYLVT